jgi:hypothetical protein
MLDPVIGYRQFVDDSKRPIFEQVNGRQYVLDDDNDRAYGVWIIPDDDIDLPLIVQREF